ncbi:MAG: glycosyltransferase family 1 protein, partial [Terracidiphilus sp.]
IVRDQLTGRIVPDDGFAPAIAALLADPNSLAPMRQAARAYALTASWDSVFEGVYTGYQSLPVAL